MTTAGRNRQDVVEDPIQDVLVLERVGSVGSLLRSPEGLGVTIFGHTSSIDQTSSRLA